MEFQNWLIELERVTKENTNNAEFLINKEAAREWFDSGCTPEQCFRENWQCDGD